MYLQIILFIEIIVESALSNDSKLIILLQNLTLLVERVLYYCLSNINNHKHFTHCSSKMSFHNTVLRGQFQTPQNKIAMCGPGFRQNIQELSKTLCFYTLPFYTIILIIVIDCLALLLSSKSDKDQIDQIHQNGKSPTQKHSTDNNNN